jgi:heme/copper-type cytochrome/quinol oxidase subunit 2
MFYLLYIVLTVIAFLMGSYWMPRSSRLNRKYPSFAHNHEARGMLLAVIIITAPISIPLMLLGIGRATLVDKQDFQPIWTW